ncbi:hypothetical protein [Pseudoxanthomonas mexicana]|uniref:hypothetical protein n=1 Tax=Pseudoxanthomonas mexicana TaxID=128785 RepID=UPI0028A8CE22|nr:hypothetical protein [Pseudoxanthomonas mexicana]
MNAVVATQEPQQPTQQMRRVPETAAEADYALQQRKAMAYSKSSLVPAAYQNNVPNVLIAMEIAARIGASDLMVMQNLYIVHGRPSWSATFLIATVNACGRFESMQFEVVGDDPTKDDYRVRAYAKHKSSGEVCRGAWITWAMVKGEGWNKKTGSKWLTMPEQMFMYRAATFWARAYAPEVAMGINTSDEVEDIQVNVVGAVRRAPLESLESRLLGNEQPQAELPPPADSDGVMLTVATVMERLQAAGDRDALDDAYELSRQLTVSDDDRKALFTAYEKRADELDA